MGVDVKPDFDFVRSGIVGLYAQLLNFSPHLSAPCGLWSKFVVRSYDEEICFNVLFTLRNCIYVSGV